MMRSRNDNGFGLLGLMGFILFIGTMCTIVTVSSIRSMKGSVRGVNQLQTLAAAEGAAELVASGDAGTSSTVRIGNCAVTILPAEDSATSQVLLTAELVINGKPAYTRDYRALITEPKPIVEVTP